MGRDPWFPFRRPAGPARLRLFCFPFAGGGASAFRTWGPLLPHEIELCAVQLPGRETRLGEARFRSLEEGLGPTVEAMAPYLDVPCALFGHSMGAAFAYEIARMLPEAAGRGPLHLFVSGRGGPALGALGRETSHTFGLPREEFVRHLRSYGGISEAVLGNADLMAVLLPLLRDDIRLVDTYVPHGGVLDCPITAFAGNRDPFVDAYRLETWALSTASQFRARLLPGGHFYLREQAAGLVDEIVQDLRSQAARP